MSLVFAAIVPHPPVLIPNIGKENINKLSKTNEALKTLEQDLYASKPDIILVISPHGEIQSKAFTINLSNKYTANFESFGDFATKLNFKGDTTLITTSKESISGKFALNIISEPNLDHGTSIPLFCLTQHIEDARIIPIYFSMLDNLTHVEFGKALKEIILSTDKRIAILASGDLSHCVTKKAPLPYHVDGKKFDDQMIELIKINDTQGIINLDHKMIENAAECGLKSILILMGILNGINTKSEILSYEAPFGVGYLVSSFKL